MIDLPAFAGSCCLRVARHVRRHALHRYVARGIAGAGLLGGGGVAGYHYAPPGVVAGPCGPVVASPGGYGGAGYGSGEFAGGALGAGRGYGRERGSDAPEPVGLSEQGADVVPATASAATVSSPSTAPDTARQATVADASPVSTTAFTVADLTPSPTALVMFAGPGNVPVPEPGGAWVLFVPLAVLAWLRRRA